MDTIILWVGLLHALMTFQYSLDTPRPLSGLILYIDDHNNVWYLVPTTPLICNRFIITYTCAVAE